MRTFFSRIRISRIFLLSVTFLTFVIFFISTIFSTFIYNNTKQQLIESLYIQAKAIDKALKKEGKKNCGCGQDPCKTYGIQEQVVNEEELEEKKKKKKACKPSKGKRFAKRVNGKCRSFGQKGQAKGGGDRIRPRTKKGDAYCARSAKIKKCKNPPCANDLSRKKWKCRGSKSMK